jgi:glutamate-1-semialdehyde 2,1-aminomutase
MPDAIVAALATLDQLALDDGPRRLEALGRSLMAGLDNAAAEAGVPARSIGLPWTPFIEFAYPSLANCARALRMFCNGMMARGVLLSPIHHWFLCTSMSDNDIEQTVGAARETFVEIRRAL